MPNLALSSCRFNALGAGPARGRPARLRQAVTAQAGQPANDLAQSNIVAAGLVREAARELSPARQGSRPSPGSSSSGGGGGASSSSGGASMRAELERQARARLEAEDGWHKQGGASLANLAAPATPREFKALVTGAPGRLVVVDYFKPSCNGCRTLYPKLLQLAANNPETLFIKVNTDAPALRELAQGMGVASLPWFQLFRDGDLLSSFTANVTSISVLRAEVAARKACDGPGCDT